MPPTERTGGGAATIRQPITPQQSAKAWRSSDLTVAVTTTIDWDSSNETDGGVYDPNGLHDPISNLTDFTIRVTGLYRVDAYGEISGATTANVGLQVQVTNTQVGTFIVVKEDGASNTNIAIRNFEHRFKAGDVVSVLFANDTAGNRTLTSIARYSPMFSLKLLQADI